MGFYQRPSFPPFDPKSQYPTKKNATFKLFGLICIIFGYRIHTLQTKMKMVKGIQDFFFSHEMQVSEDFLEFAFLEYDDIN